MVRRFSKQRELIYETLCGTTSHPTAEMLYQWLSPEHPELSLSTIYRNLNLMADEGRIQRLSFPVDRYDAIVERHAHLRCKSCGAVRDIKLMGKRPEAERGGHEIQDCEIIFHGTCQDCMDGTCERRNERWN